MGGKQAPEVAAGYLTEVLDVVMEDLETNILTSETMGFRPLVGDELEELTQEIRRARSCIVTTLRVKMDYWSRLPWLMATLALVDEGKAREFAVQILAAFDLDPRPPPVQALKTWQLLREGRWFRAELILFINGKPRWECSARFQEQIAIWRPSLMLLSRSAKIIPREKIICFRNSKQRQTFFQTRMVHIAHSSRISPHPPIPPRQTLLVTNSTLVIPTFPPLIPPSSMPLI